jgi:hypothetical protein
VSCRWRAGSRPRRSRRGSDERPARRPRSSAHRSTAPARPSRRRERWSGWWGCSASTPGGSCCRWGWGRWPSSPGLEAYRDGELLSRMVADIDQLQDVALRLLLPVGVAVVASAVVVGGVLVVSPSAGVVLGAGMAVAFLGPLVAARPPTTRRWSRSRSATPAAPGRPTPSAWPPPHSPPWPSWPPPLGSPGEVTRDPYACRRLPQVGPALQRAAGVSDWWTDGGRLASDPAADRWRRPSLPPEGDPAGRGRRAG